MIEEILTLLRHVIASMLHILGFASMSIRDENHLQVFVQTNTGKKTTLSLDKGWTIADVKKKLSSILLHPIHKIKIVFAGHELHDDMTIGDDCDIGNQSTLHAITIDLEEEEKVESQPEDRQQPMEKIQQPLLDLQLTPEEKEQIISNEDIEKNRAFFYIYCSGPCQSLQPGKLRVRCETCKEGAIVLSREPSCWTDVLEPAQITGHCESGKCDRSAMKRASFFFKCSASHEYQETPALNLVRSNLHQIPCLACGEDNCDPVVVFECNHVICLACFKAYCLSRLNERQFILDERYGYTLECPIRCQDSIIKETRHFKLMGDSDYERYQRFAAEECVLQAGGVLCPQPDCGMGIIQEVHCKRVACERGCGYVFCRDCLQGFHLGECQDQLQSNEPESEQREEPGHFFNFFSTTRAQVSSWNKVNDPSNVAIRLTTKPCPNCRTPTERDGGCMHMKCTKASCEFNWCWICQTEWTRDCMASHWFG